MKMARMTAMTTYILPILRIKSGAGVWAVSEVTAVSKNADNSGIFLFNFFIMAKVFIFSETAKGFKFLSGIL